jgi:hypothetical protein
MEEKVIWYDKKYLVLFLTIVLPPIGFFGLYKTEFISKGIKITWTIGLGLLFMMSFRLLSSYKDGGFKDNHQINLETRCNNLYNKLVELNEQSEPRSPVDLKTLINEFKNCKDSIELLTNEHALLGIKKTHTNILEQINERIGILDKKLTRINESKFAARKRQNTKLNTSENFALLEQLTNQYNIWNQTFENLQNAEESNTMRFQSQPCLEYSNRIKAQSSYERIYGIIHEWMDSQNDLQEYKELYSRFEALLIQIERRANSSANYAWYAKQGCEF